MRKKRVFKLLCICFFCLAMATPAQAGRFFAGAGVGTLGAGADIGYQFSNLVKLRINANYLAFDMSEKFDGIKYDLDVGNTTAGLLLDIHPFFGNFRISLGAYYRDLEIDLDATPKKRVKIGDTEYNPSEIGKLEGKATWDKFAPYAGIGWGTSSGTDMDFSFDFNLGVMYLKGLDIKYKMTGPAAAYGAQYEADIDREAKKIEKDLDDYDLYPVVSFFFTFRF